MQQRKRVLVLDYNPQLLITVEQVLEASGFSTVTTWDVETAFEFLETRRFDFLVVGDHPRKLDADRILRRMHMHGINCRYFPLDHSRLDKDGFRNLIDSIRNAVAPANCLGESVINDDDRVAIPALAGVGYGN